MGRLIGVGATAEMLDSAFAETDRPSREELTGPCPHSPGSLRKTVWLHLRYIEGLPLWVAGDNSVFEERWGSHVSTGSELRPGSGTGSVRRRNEDVYSFEYPDNFGDEEDSRGEGEAS